MVTLYLFSVADTLTDLCPLIKLAVRLRDCWTLSVLSLSPLFCLLRVLTRFPPSFEVVYEGGFI